MSKKIKVNAQSEIQEMYDQQIERVFILQDLTEKEWSHDEDYEIMVQRLQSAQREARRIDGLRNQITK